MTTDDAQAAPPHRKLFLAGLAVCILGPSAFGIQMLLKIFLVPWYMTVMCSAGAMLMLFAAIRRPGAWRVTGTVLGLGFAVFTWMVVLQMRLPPYSGSVQPGMPLPVFTVVTSDGDSFTQSDLRDRGRSVIVAYRSW